MDKQFEKRTIILSELRATKAGAGGGAAKISGYAVVFNSRSEDLGGFVELFLPGAFEGELDGDIRALWNHENQYVLGRTANGTLRLNEDERGLFFEIDLPDTSYAADVLALVTRGDVSQMSFGFASKDDEWVEEDDGTLLRIVKHARLFEISPVTFPAYLETSAEARAMCKQLTARTGRAAGDGADDERPAGWRAKLLKNKLRLFETEVLK